MRSLKVGDLIKDVVGPLGRPAEVEKVGTVVMVGGGTGIAILHHITKAFKEAGNYVIGIIGAKEKELIILANSSLSAIVSGILSPVSFTRTMTNCPAFALAAIFGAVTSKRTIEPLANSCFFTI